ncbi:hypothetical protein SDC9_138774 [bioreactor metagenome]|uniref:Uncharacterized protein n=1 Tax=bioreactor metagenome TaxID=1076179 RepID=A0A645DSJ6_9ZZZZ
MYEDYSKDFHNSRIPMSKYSSVSKLSSKPIFFVVNRENLADDDWYISLIIIVTIFNSSRIDKHIVLPETS